MGRYCTCHVSPLQMSQGLTMSHLNGERLSKGFPATPNQLHSQKLQTSPNNCIEGSVAKVLVARQYQSLTSGSFDMTDRMSISFHVAGKLPNHLRYFIELTFLYVSVILLIYQKDSNGTITYHVHTLNTGHPCMQPWNPLWSPQHLLPIDISPNITNTSNSAPLKCFM